MIFNKVYYIIYIINKEREIGDRFMNKDIIFVIKDNEHATYVVNSKLIGTSNNDCERAKYLKMIIEALEHPYSEPIAIDIDEWEVFSDESEDWALFERADRTGKFFTEEELTLINEQGDIDIFIKEVRKNIESLAEELAEKYGN